MAFYTYNDGHWQQYASRGSIYRNCKQDATWAQVFLIVEKTIATPGEIIQHVQVSPQGQITLEHITKGQALTLTQGTWHT